jgi:hypothetical protein
MQIRTFDPPFGDEVDRCSSPRRERGLASALQIAESGLARPYWWFGGFAGARPDAAKRRVIGRRAGCCQELRPARDGSPWRWPHAPRVGSAWGTVFMSDMNWVPRPRLGPTPGAGLGPGPAHDRPGFRWFGSWSRCAIRSSSVISSRRVERRRPSDEPFPEDPSSRNRARSQVCLGASTVVSDASVVAIAIRPRRWREERGPVGPVVRRQRSSWCCRRGDGR